MPSGVNYIFRDVVVCNQKRQALAARRRIPLGCGISRQPAWPDCIRRCGIALPAAMAHRIADPVHRAPPDRRARPQSPTAEPDRRTLHSDRQSRSPIAGAPSCAATQLGAGRALSSSPCRWRARGAGREAAPLRGRHVSGALWQRTGARERFAFSPAEPHGSCSSSIRQECTRGAQRSRE